MLLRPEMAAADDSKVHILSVQKVAAILNAAEAKVSPGELKALQVSPSDLKALLEQVPVSSNYLIENTISAGQVVGKVLDHYTTHSRSNSTIERHIALAGLKPEDSIGKFSPVPEN